MTLNEKCKIGLEEVEFIGFRIGKDGIRSEQKVQGIHEYPPPKYVKGVRSFLTMVNQLMINTARSFTACYALTNLFVKTI